MIKSGVHRMRNDLGPVEGLHQLSFSYQYADDPGEGPPLPRVEVGLLARWYGFAGPVWGR